MHKLLHFLVLCLLLLSCKENPNHSAEANHNQNEKMLVSENLPWADRMAKSIMLRHPSLWTTENPDIIKWNYKTGLLATSMLELYKNTGNQDYFNYVKAYADDVIDENGKILKYNLEDYNIDNINAGKMLFLLFEKTKDPRYKKALDTLRHQFEGHPRTPSGGLWHKKIYPNQMWLDGLYMGAPFFAQYDAKFGNGDIIDDLVFQFKLIYSKTYDPKTGLLYHAWDESKKMDWADKQTGLSPNFWSRSLGWYMMALVDVLDYIPVNHEGREELILQLNEFSEGLAKHQDESGLWWQVTNMPGKGKNYLEASSSCMISYAWAKGVQKDYLPEKYSSLAKKAHDGIVKQLITVDADGKVNINQVCKSAGLGGNPYRDGSFEYYMSEQIVTNNLHGTGPFILASLYVNK